MQIYATDGASTPTNNLLASTTISDASVPDGLSRLVGIFAAGASVQAGQQYALSVTRAATFGLRDRDGGDPCPGGGQFYSPTPGNTWTSAGDSFDMVFAVFVAALDPEPAPPKADGNLTIDANKGKVEKGRKVTLSGQLDVPGVESCERNRLIELQRRLKSKGLEVPDLQVGPTDANGTTPQGESQKDLLLPRGRRRERRLRRRTSNSQKVRVQKKKAAQEA